MATEAMTQLQEASFSSLPTPGQENSIPGKQALVNRRPCGLPYGSGVSLLCSGPCRSCLRSCPGEEDRSANDSARGQQVGKLDLPYTG